MIFFNNYQTIIDLIIDNLLINYLITILTKKVKVKYLSTKFKTENQILIKFLIMFQLLVQLNLRNLRNLKYLYKVRDKMYHMELNIIKLNNNQMQTYYLTKVIKVQININKVFQQEDQLKKKIFLMITNKFNIKTQFLYSKVLFKVLFNKFN